jgi:hypothetical protein
MNIISRGTRHEAATAATPDRCERCEKKTQDFLLTCLKALVGISHQVVASVSHQLTMPWLVFLTNQFFRDRRVKTSPMGEKCPALQPFPRKL